MGWVTPRWAWMDPDPEDPREEEDTVSLDELRLEEQRAGALEFCARCDTGRVPHETCPGCGDDD